ncbi:hypothetical protein OEZ85_002311 [Tetradesmus obliquus]|uniref:Uncharacterized protein n=1 Tax=Tetradesmus obliquus TaxID=3088 RepID=A0ABY8U2K6_TETOB|nr:hypothetical protein OEZ85_002311 [Tetradesmus obliquus]
MDLAATSLVALGVTDADVEEKQQQQQQQQAHAAAVLDICIQRHYLTAEGAARLWASSRALQQLIGSRLSRALLVRSVAAAAQAAAATAATYPVPEIALDFKSESQFDELETWPAGELTNVKALHWLLCQPAVTAATINQCSQQLLAIPGVPYAAAEALVRAGLRVQITGQQLVARAYEGFQRFEVWVEAFSAVWPRVPLEEWAADLLAELRRVCCCQSIAVTDQLPAAAVEALLRLALQLCGRELTAEQVARLLALLCGPTAAVAADAYQVLRMPGGLSVMLWLASQPAAAAAAAAAAASIGLTAADVQDRDAAALLFGGQQQAG